MNIHLCRAIGHLFIWSEGILAARPRGCCCCCRPWRRWRAGWHQQSRRLRALTVTLMPFPHLSLGPTPPRALFSRVLAYEDRNLTLKLFTSFLVRKTHAKSSRSLAPVRDSVPSHPCSALTDTAGKMSRRKEKEVQSLPPSYFGPHISPFASVGGNSPSPLPSPLSPLLLLLLLLVPPWPCMGCPSGQRAAFLRDDPSRNPGLSGT